MDGVPYDDFDARARSLVVEYFKTVLPKAVLNLIDGKETQGNIKNKRFTMPPGIDDFYTQYKPICFDSWDQLPGKVQAELIELLELKEYQDKHRRNLRTELNDLLRSVTTVREAREKLPGLAKCLPAARADDAQL